MYRFVSSRSSVSIICVIRSIPRVVTFSTWVSPRSNRAEPWARGSSTDLGRERPDVRRPAAVESDALLDHTAAHDLLLQRLPRGENSLGALAKPSSPERRDQVRLRSRPSRASSVGLALGLVGHDGASRARTAKLTSSSSRRRRRRADVASHGCALTPCAAMNSRWNSISSAIARLATSRPSATTSSVGAGARLRRAAARCCRAPRPRS